MWGSKCESMTKMSICSVGIHPHEDPLVIGDLIMELNRAKDKDREAFLAPYYTYFCYYTI